MTECDKRWRSFERTWAVAVLSLVAVSWKLWFGNSDFPAMPLLRLPTSCLRYDLVAVIVLVAALVCVAVGRRLSGRVFWWVFVGFSFSFLFNQHRLQPWAYQAAIQCVVLAALPRYSARRCFIALSISIYFFSACGKFDYQFLHTVGQDFVSVLFGPGETEPSRMRFVLAAALPVTELAVAIGLCFVKTRRLAGIAAMSMHASLIGLLGPWNLAHSTGVVLWNAWLLAQAWFLFVCKREPTAITSPSTTEVVPKSVIRPSHLFAKAIVFAAVTMPLFERAGYWDHWLSWSLYSPHTSRVTIQVHKIVLDSLPESARPFTGEDDDDRAWVALEIDRWSLSALGVPVYPQARFQLGIARSISRSISDVTGIRTQVRSASDRWTGSRLEVWLLGKKEIETYADTYLFLGE